jgi:aldose 1-epimerase
VSTGPAIPLSATDNTPVPPERGTIAIEPMAGISNSLNAAQEGTYTELQSVPSGGSWQESFWLRPTGY